MLGVVGSSWNNWLIYEAHVLRGIEFDNYRIEYLLIEARYWEAIEAVINKFYTTIAIFNNEGGYPDILYRKR